MPPLVTGCGSKTNKNAENILNYVNTDKAFIMYRTTVRRKALQPFKTERKLINGLVMTQKTRGGHKNLRCCGVDVFLLR